MKKTKTKTKHKIPNTKNNKGITLVALIITVVVLLILAAVAIRAIKDDGIINHAKNARVEYEAGEQRDENLLSPYIGKLEEHASGSSLESGSKMVEDYGKKVEYSKDLNGNGNYADDWKLFYSEGDTAYIIASDYLSNAKLPTSLNMSKSGTYGASWDTFSTLTEDGKVRINPNVATKYKLSWLANNSASLGNDNIKAVADLLNVDAWTSAFGDAENGIEAIGAPTLEMWVASWNAMGAKHGTDKYVKLYTNSNSIGYTIGDQENPTSYWYNVGGMEGYNNELYFPHRGSWNSCSGYWLASPSATYSYLVMGVSNRGHVSNSYYYDGTFAVRPLVSLPSELLVKTADGFRVDV